MRTKSLKTILETEHPTYRFTGIWAELLGEPEQNGAWLIWGEEKNGKTTLALILADYLATVEKTLYISGEEGAGANFKAACRRAGLTSDSRLRIEEYISLNHLTAALQKRNAPRIVVLDNITVYHEEMKYGGFLKLLKDNPDTLFIFLAHEDKKQPHTSSAKMCSRYAKVKIHVQGLIGFVSGRCPGGTITIDEDKAQIYWGNTLKNEGHE